MKLLALAIVLLGALSMPAAAQAPLRFSILRDGSPIGTHTVTFSRDGDGNTIAEVAIDIRVRVVFIPVFRYVHRSREVWRDGRLQALDATTDDDGRQFWVAARATAAGLAVEGSEGRFVAPPDILPASWWRGDTTQRRQLLDTRTGRIITVTATPAGSETVTAGDRRLDVQLWRLDGDIQLTVGYTSNGQWAAMQFAARGATIDYGPPAAVAGR